MSELGNLEFVRPAEIERRSFQIITDELGDRVQARHPHHGGL